MRRLLLLWAAAGVFKDGVKEVIGWNELNRSQKFAWFWVIAFIIVPTFIDDLCNRRIPFKGAK